MSIPKGGSVQGAPPLLRAHEGPSDAFDQARKHATGHLATGRYAMIAFSAAPDGAVKATCHNCPGRIE